MTNAASVLPPLKIAEEALSCLDEVWTALPRSARPEQKENVDSIRMVLGAMAEYARRAGGAAFIDGSPPEGGGGGEDDDEGEEDGRSDVSQVMDILREMSPAEVEIVKVLLTLHEFPAEMRSLVFEDIKLVHCIKCGEEVPEGERAAHKCAEPTDEEDNDEESEEAVDGAD